MSTTGEIVPTVNGTPRKLSDHRGEIRRSAAPQSHLHARTASGTLVPLSNVASITRTVQPIRLLRDRAL